MSTENKFTVRPDGCCIRAEFSGDEFSGVGIAHLTLTRDEAINLAAWIAAVADPEHALEPHGPFQTTLRAIVTT